MKIEIVIIGYILDNYTRKDLSPGPVYFRFYSSFLYNTKKKGQ